MADAARLERIFGAAGFRDVRVKRETREGIVESFDEYWAPIEAGTGQMPQAYLALPEPSRRAVREEVHARLSQFESNGRLVMSVEDVDWGWPGIEAGGVKPWRLTMRVTGRRGAKRRGYPTAKLLGGPVHARVSHHEVELRHHR